MMNLYRNNKENNMKIEHVPGKKTANVMLYALSTCGWCRKTRELLDSLGVEYDYVYVDLLTGKDREEAIKMVEKWNPSRSFPVVVLNDTKCIIGFKEDDLKQALK